MQDYIRSILDKMKERLLDLTRRNPLINTRFSERSHSHIRIVDELPEVIFKKIVDSSMIFQPLPSIDEPLPDELTNKFKKTLIEFKNTDEIYRRELEGIDHSSENSARELLRIERDLIDRVRAHLRLPKRVWSEKSLDEHAKLHGINPSYNLPMPKQVHSDGRHNDNFIQTLLLPDMLERRLEKLTSKCNSWLDETGVPVLFVAYGFLEWKEVTDSKVSLSPLLLHSCKIDKKKTVQGLEFSLSSDDDSLQDNLSLSLKLKTDFGIDLDEFSNLIESQNIEEYLNSVDEIKPKTIDHWRVLRQVAIGIFPSSKQIMYEDLNSTKWELSTHPLVSEFFGSSEKESLILDEEIIVDPFDESAPWVVCDADSSQYAVIKRLIQGENLAVEGPPGTGKSQTIVNSIAAAMAEGKTVLFVAEKSAALNVVNSRLEASGLGSFCFPIMAGQQPRSTVYEHIRSRVEMKHQRVPSRFEDDFARLNEIKETIDKNIGVLTRRSAFGDLTFQDIISKVIATNQFYDQLPIEVKELRNTIPENISLTQTESAKEVLSHLQKSKLQLRKLDSPWKEVNNFQINKFHLDDISSSLNRIINEIDTLICKLDNIDLIRFFSSVQTKTLPETFNTILYLEGLNLGESFKESELHNSDPSQIEEFLVVVDKLSKSVEFLGPDFHNKKIDDHKAVLNYMTEFGLDRATKNAIEKIGEDISKKLSKLNLIDTSLNDLKQIFEDALEFDFELLNWSLSTGANLEQNKKDILTFILKNRIDESDLTEIFEEHKELADEHAKLNSRFNLEQVKETDLLMDHTITIANAGFFRFLSPSFWKAKKYYLSIDPKGFSIRSAAENLRRIRLWINQSKAFRQNKEGQQILGPHFKGIETDVDSFSLNLEKIKSMPLKKVTDFLSVAKLFESLKSRELDFFNEQLSPLLSQLQAKNYDELLMKKKESERNLGVFQEKKHHFLNALDATGVGKRNFTKDDLEHEVFLRDLCIKLSTFLKTMNYNFCLDNIESDISQCHRFLLAHKKLASLDKNSSSVVFKIFRENKVNEFKNYSQDLESSIFSIIRYAKDISSICKSTTWFLNEPICTQKVLIERMLSSVESLPILGEVKKCTLQLEEIGLSSFASKLDSFGIGEQTPELFETLVYREIAKKIYNKSELGDFGSPGKDVDALRKEFAELDRRHVQDTQVALQSHLIENSDPPYGNGSGKKSTWTDMALIKNEIAKKQRFRSIRDLISRSKSALIELMPCWIMSPMAVAQYLPKGPVDFDIVIIDEASQMTSENAMGTLLRGKQAMIVGDTNQLPPTNFFMKNYADDEDEDNQESLLSDQSILNVANAVFTPQKRLRWHYRSQHSGLIAFSNEYIYGNDLEIFPAPDEVSSGKGVSLVEIEGTYKGGLNSKEADAIVKAALNEMKNHPDYSLGLVTMNQKQKELIEDELQLAFDRDPDCQKYLKKWNTEEDGLQKFFVKNLENVQGDERDTIIIGTLYGPEVNGGRTHQRFGPINGPTGKRRLNVLFSRAKRKIITYTSMTPADILATKEANEGAWLLKKWLEYSKTNIIDYSRETGKEPDSEFEKFVIKQIEAMGCIAVPQVGVSGYFIDIGVRHPSWEYGYLLGVECDGATYHSQKSARDRDRLREEVLKSLGWDLHRIWSTNWFEDPATEIEKLRKAIEDKLTEIPIYKKYS